MKSINSYSYEGEFIIVPSECYLYFHYVNGKFSHHSKTYRIEGNCDIKFLFYFLESKREYFSQQGEGSSVVRFSKNIYKNIETFVNRKTQQKIAKFFSLLDKQIELWETKLQLSELLKKYWINFFTNKNNFNYLESFLIDSILDVTRGNVLSTKNIQKNKSITFNYPVYSSQTFNNGILGYYDKYIFEDSIIWTTDGANAGYFRYIKEKFYCTNVCGVLISKNKERQADLYKSFILNKISKKYVSTQLGNPKLMNNIVKKIVIFLPSENLCKKISHLFFLMDKKINYQKKIIELTKNKKIFFLYNCFLN